MLRFTPPRADMLTEAPAKPDVQTLKRLIIESEIMPHHDGASVKLTAANYKPVLVGTLEVERLSEGSFKEQCTVAGLEVTRSTQILNEYVLSYGGQTQALSVVVGSHLRLTDPVQRTVVDEASRVVRVSERELVVRVYGSTVLPGTVVACVLPNDKDYARAICVVEQSPAFLDEEFCLHRDLPDRGRRERETGMRELIRSDVYDHENRLLSDDQRDTVNFILHHCCMPRVTLLWGPPGTGKSTTLAALVNTYCTRKQGGRILICTPSNYAADHIVELLAQYGVPLRKGQLLRVQAKHRKRADLSDVVEFYSVSGGVEQTDGSKFESRMPTAAEVRDARVVVCTMSTAATMLQRVFGFDRDALPDFDYVIVDEAAQCTEVDLLHAMAYVKDATRMVLAGDPQQLGPTVHSLELKGPCYSYDKSPMKRLMESRAVMRGAVIQLRDSFRFDPEVLRYVNEFYDGRLRHARRVVCGSGNVWGTGLTFVDVTGAEHRDPCSPSRGNMAEVDEVERLLLSLPSDRLAVTVVLTPYMLQARILRERLDLNPSLRRVTVSTVEAFQGREADVVIVSVVRCDGGEPCDEHLAGRQMGFAGSEPRVNAAISRARDQVFVVGDTSRMADDKAWGKLVHLYKRSLLRA